MSGALQNQTSNYVGIFRNTTVSHYRGQIAIAKLLFILTSTRTNKFCYDNRDIQVMLLQKRSTIAR